MKLAVSLRPILIYLQHTRKCPRSQHTCPRSHNCADWELNNPNNILGTSKLDDVHEYQVSFQSVETMEVVYIKSFHT